MKIFVPGRICLVGEHSDWAGGYRRINAAIERGYTLITGTDQGIYAEVEPHPTSLMLTSALDRLRQEDGFQGLVIDGRRFDIGLPDSYLETLQVYRR